MTVKIGFFAVFLIILSLAVFSFVLIRSERDKMRSDIVENGKVFAEFAANSIYQDYVMLYPQTAGQEFSTFKEAVEHKLSKNKDIVKMYLVGINGKILFDSDELELGAYQGESYRYEPDLVIKELLKSDNVESREKEYKGEDVAVIIVPIRESSGGHFLSIVYYVSYNSLEQRMKEIYNQIFIVLIPVLIITLLVAIPFAFRITKPIISLTNASQKISSGELNITIDESIKRGHDEISALALQFDTMREAIKAQKTQLMDYNENLEKKIVQRTKELERKNDELKKINEVAIGRELKMVELKKRITELESGSKKGSAGKKKKA
ncbi:HAMP domain-containing protein [Candidatus Woesearchaeota archaeon]|nr:HAMP domain-containing protein [Candidatus Woesearchaeota archaeon]